MASWGERLTRISAETTDVKRVAVVVVVDKLVAGLVFVKGKPNALRTAGHLTRTTAIKPC